jgi:16S rRNA (cytidine1402-2'-O)-methyltransferase
MGAPSPTPGGRGRLWLMPATLDLGTLAADAPPPDLRQVLPLAALEVAARLGHWVAENAKSARALLKRVDAVVPLAAPLQSLSIVELPRPPKGRPAGAPPDLSALLAPALAGHDLGLVSEAGLPAVADPGAALVRAAHAAGIEVMPLSGPSSLMLALAASGLNGQRFAFVGYLPTDAGERARRIRALEQRSRQEDEAQLLIETPYRNEAMLQALVATLAPTAWLSVSCGLTLDGGATRSDRVTAWRANPGALPLQLPTVFAFQAG